MNKSAENIISLFNEVRLSSLKRFYAIPEGKENWRISEGKMSIADIAHHLIESDKWTIKKIKSPEIKSINGAANVITITSRKQYSNLLQELENILQSKILAVKNLNYWDYDKTIYDDRFQKEVNLWFMIMCGNVDHEIHHRGQISAYLQFLTSGS
ncbi:MAG: hypothetical protein KKB34_02450 [Bacteroidetes bacterium]|nr:hypothetical protein [Bacteroidota bacterium]